MKLIATIHQYDVSMFTWCMNRKHLNIFAEISRRISQTGDGYLYALLGVYLLCSSLTEDRNFLIVALFAFAVERLLYFVLKNGLKRDRPQEAIGIKSFIIPSDKFSFPSGHTSGAFLMATLITYYHPALGLPVYMWSTSVGLSRIFLGVHFPTDILVGMLMGFSVACLAINFV
ncbi:MAG: phosphatase PAP2 family protein [Methylococcaceae bacterium]